MQPDHPNRPRLHFTPPAGWMNDPNGLIRLGDTYHLYYQHNPHDVAWGDIHWGHATSTDLITWTHRAIAIAPDTDGQIFSGTVAADVDDSAGFGAGALVAAYTNDLDGYQTQALAWSTDGFEWTKHSGNPVLRPPDGVSDFRDPKLVRSESGDGWTMVLAVGDTIEFHRSSDLRDWHHASSLRLPLPPPGAIVEVPELVRVPVGGTDESEWVLVVSVMPPHGVRGRRSLLWVAGEFDGHRFVPTAPSRLLDHGQDLYAAMAWDLGHQQSPVLIGWLDDGCIVSTTKRPWRGRLCLPRRLELHRRNEQVDLVQTPVLPTASLDRTTAIVGSATIDEATLLLSAEGSGSVRLCDRVSGQVLFVAEGDDLDITVIVDQGCVESFVDGSASTTATIFELQPGPIDLDVRGSIEATVVGFPAPSASASSP